MNIEFKGRKAIITGSTAGVGRAIAEGLARAGASVIINGRGEEQVAQTLRDFCELLPQAELSGVTADLTTLEGESALVRQAPDADIVVNNVDTARPKSLSDLADGEWLGLFQVDVMSGARATRHYLPKMIERGWGRVVFISSESAFVGPKDMSNYAATEAARLAYLKGLAGLVGGTGVTINAVITRLANSELPPRRVKAMPKSEATTQEEVKRQFLKTRHQATLINSFATVEEVANLVTYVCSEQASEITGAVMRVDGDVLRSIA